MNLYYESNSLQHHGIKGMRWGVRRFQKKDGSLTPAGEKRYSPKTTAEKKAIEDLKGQRSARRLNALKQLQQMRQDSLDRAATRKAMRDKSAAEREQARNEKEKLKLEKQQIKDKRKFDERAQDQQALDQTRQYKLSNKHLRFEKEQFRSQNKQSDVTPDSDGYYELPDTSERQRSSASTGKKLIGGALAVAGTVAVAAAAKKYGPSILSGLKKGASKVKDVAKEAKDSGADDFALEVFREVSKYRGQQAISSGPSTPLLAAPSSGSGSTSGGSSSPSPVSGVMNTIGNIPLYLAS